MGVVRSVQFFYLVVCTLEAMQPCTQMLHNRVAERHQITLALQAAYLDRDAQHEAEQQLVLFKQAAAHVAVQGVGDVSPQVADARGQSV